MLKWIGLARSGSTNSASKTGQSGCKFGGARSDRSGTGCKLGMMLNMESDWIVIAIGN